MPKDDWTLQPSFNHLCNILAADNAVFLTGAGISRSMKRQSDNQPLPGWWELLDEMAREFDRDLNLQDRIDVQRILSEKQVPGSLLIQVASILRAAVGNDHFYDVLCRLVTPVPESTTETHLVIQRLKPKGIVTFNYDDGHENAAHREGTSVDPILPSEDGRLASAARNNTNTAQSFLLKAHGSVHDKSSMVLTQEGYRDLFVRSPAYRAFIQNVLTNCALVIVGFGLSDPDFDGFIRDVVHVFGSPLQEHVVIRGVSDQSAMEVELRRRFGIHSLYVSDFSEIPALLEFAASTLGSHLEPLVRQAVKGSHVERSTAHRRLVRLGPAGRRAVLATLDRQRSDAKTAHELAEIAYSMGVVDAEWSKSALISIVEEPHGFADLAPQARALTVLRPVLKLDDLPMIRRWLEMFRAQFTDPSKDDYRLVVYTEYLLYYVKAKFAS